MHLYRVVSEKENENIRKTGGFSTALNTIEGKQFFKTENAVREFARIATLRNYKPPYKYLIIVTIEEEKLNRLNVDHINLDGFDAITIQEDDLNLFNKNINFILQNEI